ncbi:LiaF transmembrane domain-containing protein [Compostibacter hankyongensis]|uniref:DUF5668 domain-containing protein n=1 Tax=Compostibacter hankyongensis TaxID=1007089 RepID=A0ABP8G8Q8_9BACT
MEEDMHKEPEAGGSDPAGASRREERLRRRAAAFSARQRELMNRRYRSHSVWSGIVILGIGLVYLAAQLGAPIPSWVFTWPMILILVGFFMGIKHRFRDIASIVLMLIGFGFLSENIWEFTFHFRQLIWPLIIIVIGLIIIIRPKRASNWQEWEKRRGHGPWGPKPWAHTHTHTHGPKTGPEWDALKEKWEDVREKWEEKFEARGPHESVRAGEDRLDTAAVFCGIRRTVFSKNFKGGDAVTVFGGTELNLAQADFSESDIAVLDVVVIFGGLKLTVPPGWEVRSNVITIFAGVEDKRYLNPGDTSGKKVLLITGTALFGGIDIRN